MDTLKRIRYILDQKQKRGLFLLFILMVIESFLELLGVSAILPLINTAMDPASINDSGFLNTVYNFLNIDSVTAFIIFLALFLIFIYIFKGLFIISKSFLQARFIYSSQNSVSCKLLKKYMDKPYLYHINKNSSELQRVVINDTSQLFLVINSFLSFMTECIVALMLVVYLLITDIEITLMVVVVLGLSLLIIFGSVKRLVRRNGELCVTNYGKMIQWVSQSLGSIKEIKVMRNESYFTKSFKKYSSQYATTMKWRDFLNGLPKPIIEMLSMSSVLLAMVFKLLKAEDATAIIPQLSVFAIAAIRLLPSVTRMNNYLNNIVFYKASVKLVYEALLDTKHKTENKLVAKERTSSLKQQSNENGIMIKDLAFHYPHSSKNVLEKINLFIPYGKAIAITGTSGGGKTTLVDLILGILPVMSGEIHGFGMKISDNMDEWSKNFGYIPQSIYLLDDSIKNNIAFGIHQEAIDEARLKEIIEKAQLTDFIDHLENGWDTLVGEQGTRLSGGQRQRIGIARALYRDPAILVFDEATSALDSETENSVMEAIESLFGKKTIIIIAHRLSTIKNCDLVYEVSDGKATQYNTLEYLNKNNK